MHSRNFEDKLIEILGKTSTNRIVKSLFDELREVPDIDIGDLGLPDDTLDYSYLSAGLCFLFAKSGKLTCVRIYFSNTDEFKKFNGHYNDFITSETTKNQIIQKLGKPTRENNEISHSFGRTIPRWIAYDYDYYSINYSFEGIVNKLATISIMMPDVAPGRNI